MSGEHQIQSVVILGAFAIVFLVIGFTLPEIMPGHADTGGFEQAGKWCADRGGELQMSNSLVHGGLHCRIPNGTVVHMADVNATGGTG